MADKLSFWGADFNNSLLSLDYGNVPRRSASSDEQIRVKNESTEYDATGVTVTVTGDHADQIYLSADDGFTFTASVDLGDLPALMLSRPITIRRTTPSSAPLGATTAQLSVQADSWVPAHQLS